MRNRSKYFFLVVIIAGTLASFGCAKKPKTGVSSSPAPLASPSPDEDQKTPGNAITLPVLHAMFLDEAFKSDLRSKLQLSDEQIASLEKSANEEVARLRAIKAEEQTGDAAAARVLAAETIFRTVGEKADSVLALIDQHWVRGSEELESELPKPEQFSLLPEPNAVPTDSRVVVNIPAYRMDLFKQGTLLKSYKIGIGYPAFPLPTGLRKAQQIIFNPTWTPPDEPWVNSMKGIKPGERIAAGSALNPLGPVKIPIGMPSLIHGGKPPSKLGNFASHGCVGLTNAQVRDFARLLADAAETELSAKALESFLRDKTKTKVLRLQNVVPVELRYETIVASDGKLHIYKDVYDQNSNTETALLEVLEANALSMEDLTEEERAEVLLELNAMSARPKKLSIATPAKATDTLSMEEGPTKTVRKNPKARVVAIEALMGKGYPAWPSP